MPSNNIPTRLADEYGIHYLVDTYMNTIWVIAAVVDENFIPMSGRLFQSDDKGITWYVRSPSIPQVGGDGSLKFRNPSVALYKNNGLLYRTMDGGTTWNVVNYSGNWFSFDLDNIPGIAGSWISTGGGTKNPVNPNSVKGFGSSISYDDGEHWTVLDREMNHTCVDMTSPVHGYSGGVATGSGTDGVFVYAPLHPFGSKHSDCFCIR